MIHDENWRGQAGSVWKWAVPAIAMILAATTVMGWTTISNERQRAEELTQKNRSLTDALARMQGQMDAMSSRMTSLTAALQAKEQAAAEIAEEAPAVIDSAKRPLTVKRMPVRSAAKPKPAQPAVLHDPRVDQLQTRLSDQEKALASTRDQLAQARTELEGQLGSTKTELSGSIARTHEELVELQKRGERNYYEFDLLKTKDFKRIGPLGLSLRKADTKRRSYNLKLRVDDQEMEKKSVNLFEPLLISAPDSPQPVQLVVNDISKDRIRGYISEPKFKQTAANASTHATPALQSRE